MKALRCPSCKNKIKQPVCPHCNETVLKNLIELSSKYTRINTEYQKLAKKVVLIFLGLLLLAVIVASQKYIILCYGFMAISIGYFLFNFKRVSSLLTEVQELQSQIIDYDPNFLKKIIQRLAGMMLLHNLLDYLEVEIRDLSGHGIDVNTYGNIAGNASDASVGNVGNQADVNGMLPVVPQQLVDSCYSGIQLNNMGDLDQYTTNVINNPLNNQGVQIDINNNFAEHYPENVTHHIINNDGMHIGDMHETTHSVTVTNNSGITIIDVEKGYNVDVIKDHYGYATGYINHGVYYDTISNHYGETEILINCNGTIYNKIGDQVGSFRVSENGLKIYDRYGMLDKTIQM